MPRRRATVDQASIARVLRAAKQTGIAMRVRFEKATGDVLVEPAQPLAPEQSTTTGWDDV